MSTKSAETSPNFTFESGVRDWLAGFLLVGTLLGLMGSLLIAWQYHINVDPRLFGLHFLGLNAGYVVAAALTQRALTRVSIRGVAMFACALGFASLLALSVLVPPAAAASRIVGLAFVGASGGMLLSTLLYVLEPYFERAPAAVSNLAGVLFGCGCLLATGTTAATYFASSGKMQTALLALVPLIFLALYAANKYPAGRATVRTRNQQTVLREALRDLRSVAAVLFSLLLFFQFGNECAIAGWLPFFLVQRQGTSPVWAIFALGLYFLAMMIARIAARPLLPRVKHRKLLLLSIVTAIVGYLLLSFTASMAGAWLAVVLVGCGFAPIYPLIAETLDERFHFHPGFYSGLFSIAITGGMCVPWILGYVDAYLGLQYVMLVPALGSIAVLALALLIMLEARMMGASESGGIARATAAAAGEP